MIGPDGILIGVPVSLKGPPPETPLAEVGADFADLPTADAVRKACGKKTAITMIGSHILTHRRSDQRYKAMTNPPPEHAAVGHFERSRWTDEAWADTDSLARALDAQAVVFQTPPSFKASTEHATRLENFVAHAMRPRIALIWEWAKGSWPERKALDLCDRIGAIPLVDPIGTEIPEAEFVYLRIGRPNSKRVLKDDELKDIALKVRDRAGWIVFSGPGGAADERRLLDML
ncbi:MAG: DUF72 domain-containing protein [Actinomycetota bacterium]